MFKDIREDDDENEEEHRRNDDEESFIPRSRLMPIVFMLLAFVPMVYLVRFVEGHLVEYLPSLNITTFFGSFYIFFSTLFLGVFLLSFIVWAGSFIKARNIGRGLGR